MTEIRDRIAQRLAETLNETSYVWVRSIADSAYELAIDGDVDTGVLADAILPLIREAQAEALDDAAAFLKPTGVVWYGDGGVTVYADGAYGGNRMDLIDWLNSRAATYRVGEGQHG